MKNNRSQIKLASLVAAPLILLGSWGLISHADLSRPAGRIDAIVFDSEKHGFVHVCCPHPSQVYETSDGGRTWTLSGSTEARLRRGRVFVSALKGFSVEEDAWPHSEIHATEDGGRTWKRTFRADQQGAFMFGAIQAISDSEIWAGFYRTDNGGLSWKKSSLPGGLFYFLSREQGWSVGEKAIWTTNDSGLNWRRLARLPDLKEIELNDIYFADKEHGWLVGGSQKNNVEGGDLVSVLWATDDGGTTWQRRAGISGHYLASVFFLDERRGWAGGTGRTFLTTRDGGRTWSPVNFP